MTKLTVAIKKFEEVGRFVNIVDRMVGDVDLKYGRYIVDARSVVGVATLVGVKALELQIHHPQSSEVEDQMRYFLCDAA